MASRIERSSYRDKARIISIVDIVCSTINLGHTFIGFLSISAYLSQLNNIDSSSMEHRKDYIHFDNGREGSSVGGPNGEIVFSPKAFKKLAWMIVMAQFAIHFSQLTFAINLYIGTAKIADSNRARAACRLWFITSSLLLGILGLRLFFQGSTGIYYMSEIIFRAVGMYIVGEYAKEVKNGINGTIYPPPPPVYFSRDDQLNLPVFLPPHQDLPPKYEDIMNNEHVIRQTQTQSDTHPTQHLHNPVPIVPGSVPLALPLSTPINHNNNSYTSHRDNNDAIPPV